MAGKYGSFKHPTVFLTFGSKSDRLAFIISLATTLIEVIAIAFVLMSAYYAVGKPDYKKATVSIANFDAGYSGVHNTQVPKVILALDLVADSAANAAAITLLGPDPVCGGATNYSTSTFEYDTNAVTAERWAALCFIDTAKCARGAGTITVDTTAVPYTDANILQILLAGGCYELENKLSTVAFNIGELLVAQTEFTEQSEIKFTTNTEVTNVEEARSLVNDGEASVVLILEPTLSQQFVDNLDGTTPTTKGLTELVVDSGASYGVARSVGALVRKKLMFAAERTLASFLVTSPYTYKSIAAAHTGTDAELVAAIEAGAISAYVPSTISTADPARIAGVEYLSFARMTDMHEAHTYGSFLFTYLPFISASIAFVLMAVLFFPLWRTQANGKLVMGPMIAMLGKLCMYVLCSAVVAFSAFFMYIVKGERTFVENGDIWWVILVIFSGSMAIGGLQAVVYGIFGAVGSFINTMITFFMITCSNTNLPLFVLPDIVEKIGQHGPMYHAVCLLKWALLGASTPEERAVHWYYIGGYIAGGMIIGLSLQVAKFGRFVACLIMPRFFGPQSVAQSM